MRSATAPLVGAGVAAAASLAAWPVVILVASSPLAAAGGSGAAAELMWGLLLGALGGASGAVASGAVSRRDWPRSAFVALVIWLTLMVALLSLSTVPLLFVSGASLSAAVAGYMVVTRWRPPYVGARIRSMLAGAVGFVAFITALVSVLAVAVRDRPLGVTPEAWLRYMNDVDVRGAATLGIGVATAVLVSVATERSATRAIGAALGFGLLFVLSTPLLAFWSACYAGDVLAIFRWLGPRTC